MCSVASATCWMPAVPWLPLWSEPEHPAHVQSLWREAKGAIVPCLENCGLSVVGERDYFLYKMDC